MTALFRQLDVDYVQWKAVTRTLLRTDFRLPLTEGPSGFGRVRSLAIMFLILSVFGLGAAAIVFINPNVLLTERGASFGYNNLVVDLRSFPIMRSFGVPVVFDVTHSLQLPGGLGKATGGQSEYIENFARAGVACGIDAVFIEAHDNTAKAASDGPNQLPLSRLENLLVKLKQIHELVNDNHAKATTSERGE